MAILTGLTGAAAVTAMPNLLRLRTRRRRGFAAGMMPTVTWLP